MRKLSENKFLWILVGALLGSAVTYTAPKFFLKKKTQREQFLDEMDKFQQDWSDHFGESNQMEEIFQNFFRRGAQGGFQNQLKTTQDENTVTYEITVKNLASGEVRVNVKNGMIRIDGNTTQKSSEGGVQKESTSSFQRYFPVPEGIDESSVKIKQEKDKIILTFTKKGSA